MFSMYYVMILDLQYPVCKKKTLFLITIARFFVLSNLTHMTNFKFLYSTSSTLLPIVGVVVTTWFINLYEMSVLDYKLLSTYTYSLYNIVVLPALSKPTIISLT